MTESSAFAVHDDIIYLDRDHQKLVRSQIRDIDHATDMVYFIGERFGFKMRDIGQKWMLLPLPTTSIPDLARIASLEHENKTLRSANMSLQKQQYDAATNTGRIDLGELTDHFKGIEHDQGDRA